MVDQAAKLRQLVIDALPRTDGAAAMPPTIVVTGGKGGVGGTTVAVNLAAALAQGGRRTVLVDAAPHADTAQLLGIEVERGSSLDDVLIGARAAVDALQSGPAGISLLSGRWATEESPDRSSRSFDRLLEQLQSLHTKADVLVIDSGNGINAWTQQLWRQATLVLVVTTQDDLAVMDAYATIKRGISDDASDVRILVNQAVETGTAVDVQSRLAATCRRFLGRTIARAPWLPRHIPGPLAGNEAPLAWEAPASPLARSVHQLGRFAADIIAQQDRNQRTGGSRSFDARHPKRELSTC